MSGVSPLISGSEWSLLVHHFQPLIRPFLAVHPGREGLGGKPGDPEPLNGLNCRLQLSCGAVVDAIERRYLPSPGSRCLGDRNVVRGVGSGQPALG